MNLVSAWWTNIRNGLYMTKLPPENRMCVVFVFFFAHILLSVELTRMRWWCRFCWFWWFTHTAVEKILIFDFLSHFSSTFIGIWSECNRSEDSCDTSAIKKSDSPPVPVWTPKSAPQSPNVERRFKPVPFDSPTPARRKLTNGAVTPPPWSAPDYPDKPYQASIIKSSSWNAISAPKQQQSSKFVNYRKARGERGQWWKIISNFEVAIFCLSNSCWAHKRAIRQESAVLIIAKGEVSDIQSNWR